MRTAYFHEDDYRQVEFLPVTSLPEITAEMNRIEEFVSPQPSSTGFTGMYVREGPEESLTGLGVTLVDWKAALEPALRPFDAVETGYSTYREPCPTAWAWGDVGFTIFAEPDAEGRVRWAWMNAWIVEDVAWFTGILAGLPRAEELVLVDWGRGEIVRLADVAAVAAYLRGPE